MPKTVLDAATKDLDNSEPKVDRLLRREEVMEVTGLSLTGLYSRMAAGTFPRPVRLNGGKGATCRAVAWPASWVAQWIADCIGRQNGAIAWGPGSGPR
jgi:prophage regulatory protein